MEKNFIDLVSNISYFADEKNNFFESYTYPILLKLNNDYNSNTLNKNKLVDSMNDIFNNQLKFYTDFWNKKDIYNYFSTIDKEHKDFINKYLLDKYIGYITGYDADY